MHFYPRTRCTNTLQGGVNVMYNRRISNQPEDRLKEQGGIQRLRTGNIELSHDQNHVSERITATQRPVRVYTQSQNVRGPLALKPPNYTFYDLMTNDEDEEIREYSFEDWVFPTIKKLNGGTPQESLCMIPERTIRRGRLIGGSDYQNEVSQATVTQYAYIILNPGRTPVPSFGTYPGMSFSRMSYLVCLEIGDPRSGNLSNAFIQYALLLATPISKCIEVTTASMASRAPTEPGSIEYYYKVNGDPQLEKDIFDRWFNSSDYYFNSVIYPTIRNYMVL